MCLQSANNFIKGVQVDEIETNHENLFDDFDCDKILLFWQE